MPAACPTGIMEVIKSMPLRLTNLAMKMDTIMGMQVHSDSKPLAAICDGSVSEQDSTLLPLLEKALDTFDNSQVGATVHESIPAASEKSTSLTTLEKLEKLRAAVKKQDAAKKECIEGTTDVKSKSQDDGRPEKDRKKKDDTKKGKTDSKQNAKGDKSKEKDIEKEKLAQQKGKGQNHKDKTKGQKTKHRMEKKQTEKTVDKKGGKRKQLSMTKKCYTSRAYHEVYDRAIKAGELDDAKPKAREASFKAGLEWEKIYGEAAIQAS